MANLLASVWNWATGRRPMPDLPPNMIYEKDVSSDNDFWISCIFDPTMDIMYVNGMVTHILDTDKCLIDGRYHYQPKTEKEIRNFPYIELNSTVRISLYRKKNSNTEWKVASCFLTNCGPCHRAVRHRTNNFAQIQPDELTIQTIENANNKLNTNVDNETMSVEVMGDMPKIVCFEKESTIQILFRNNSYAKEEELLDYQIPRENRSQLSIVDKVELPVKIRIQSHYIFDIKLTGKYIGRSTEKVEFIFKDITYKVGINIQVTDSRIIVSDNMGQYTKPEIDLKKLFELQNDFIIPGVRSFNKVQFPAVRIRSWDIPSQLMKCFWTENGKYNCDNNEINDKISKFYPAAFEALTYQNYKAKFHTLLFIDELETLSALQKYAKERISFEHCGEYLVLKIPDLSEQRPSLIPGDRITVTDPPNCKKQLGDNPGRYEGIIHKIMANEIWLKFDPVFHQICGHWDFSVNFFNSRMMARKQHEVVNELWKNNRLGEMFLFPFKDEFDYQLPKLIIANIDEMIDLDNLNKNNKTLVMRPKVIEKLTWFNKSLNNEQRRAVISILKNEARPMPYVIYGPPGTGKTVTLTESIIQVYKEFPKSKLLICAPTNSAVDLLLIKLVASGLFDKTIIRRLISFSYYMSSSYNQDYDEYCAFPEFEGSNFGSQTQEKDLKLINKRDILKLRIIITTEGTASVLYVMGFKNKTFTHIFIDEAGQSTEPELLLPLSLLDPYQDGQVILAGDPQQLGPVVFSIIARNNGLGQSMLTRFINYPSYQRDPNLFPEYSGFNPKVITHLVKNYRSVPEIVHNFSELFYNSLLKATILDDNVPEKVFLKNLNSNTQWSIGCKGPVIVHGIVGEDSQDPSSPSWFNPHEAFQVLLYVTNLMKAGVAAYNIGIITPYIAQVAKINEILKMYHPDIELPKVGTVEMFQGQERMVIIISIVRSKSKTGAEKDKKFNLGFLIAKERTNVAISRAKALMIVIGDPFTMLCTHQWKYILLIAYKNNNYVGCNFFEQLN